jgi:hypothetical protein
MSDGRVTTEEIKLAIATTAYCIRRHDMPELLPALDRDGEKLVGGAA